MVRTIISLGILILLPAFLEAAVFEVSTVADLDSKLSIAEGNGENDTINIVKGIYQPPLTVSLSYDSQEDKSITIQSVGGEVIIDGSFNNHRLLFVRTSKSNANIHINGITFQNGYSPENENGSGLFINIASADLLLENVKLLDCFGAAFYFTNHGGGGFVTAGFGADVIIRNCVIAGNTAKGLGGGLYLNMINGTLSFINNTIINNHNNTGVVEGGGGVYLRLFFDAATANIYNNIFWDNTYDSGDGDLYIEDNGDNNTDDNQVPIPSTVYMHNNDYYQLDYHIGTALTLSNNISQDPLLTADFHLPDNSPCLDQGTALAPNLPSRDFENDPRSYDGDRDGTRTPDMGADEFYRFLLSPVFHMLLLQ